jgi:catechol 2,3-dioxygenase-like lactoylglutathione lyase family enzyme
MATSLLALFLCLSGKADDKHPRPRILAIAGVHFSSTNITATRGFYTKLLPAGGLFSDECLWCEGVPLKGKTQGPEIAHRFPLIAKLDSGQLVILSELHDTPPPNLLDEVVFATDNVQAMKKYLAANQVAIENKKDLSGNYFSVIDPEGHRISFTQAPQSMTPASSANLRIIHAGFVVHDRAAEDKFYKDILGFHVYWHGGRTDDETSWVDMQVPDGTDWLEYMLNVSPNATHKTLGVMNHIALGVADIHAAQQQLIKNGWKGTEEPKIGRDGKWQLNLYDPDETRIELMEFKPTKEPCCSPYAGPHPEGPHQ